MAYDGRIFRVLIASPSDVEDEREIAVRVIQEWNDLHSYARKVVLLPLRWETHTAPTYGVRPQEAINRQIVDDCDLLVGIFWTRLGTATGVADSGTQEEIERVAAAGKPVMLYFSKVGVAPDELDLEQVARVKQFKAKTYPNALVENYRSIIDFRDKLSRQIEMKIRELQSADKSGRPTISLEFFDGASNSLLGASVSQEVLIPDFSNLENAIGRLAENRQEKVRKQIRRAMLERSTIAVTLAISNSGSSSIHNLFIEFSAEVIAGKTTVASALPHDSSDDVYRLASLALFNRAFDDSNPFRKVAHALLGPRRLPESAFNRKFRFDPKTKDRWDESEEWVALQPSRAKVIDSPLFVTAESDSEIRISAKVFADSFPQPIVLDAMLLVKVKTVVLPADLLPASLLENDDSDKPDLNLPG